MAGRSAGRGERRTASGSGSAAAIPNASAKSATYFEGDGREEERANGAGWVCKACCEWEKEGQSVGVIGWDIGGCRVEHR